MSPQPKSHQNSRADDRARAEASRSAPDTQAPPVAAPGSERPRSFGLVRGERWIASAGLVTAALLALVAALAGGWAWWHAEQTAQRQHAALIRSQGQMLADAVASLARSNDLSGIRQLAGVRAIATGLDDVCVRLGDGTIIASSDPTRIQTMTAPEAWPILSEQLAREIVEHETVGGLSRASFVAQADAEKTLVVEIRDGVTARGDGATLVAGVLASVCVALIGFLALYRWVRSRMRAMIALRAAVVTFAAGERERAALELGDGLGDEAKGWNALLDELAKVEAATTADASGAARPTEMATGDFRPVCDAMWHGLMVVDDSGMILYANGAAGILLGKPRDVLMCAAISEAVDCPEITRAVDTATTGETRQRVTVEMQRGDGAGVLRVGVRSLRKGDLPAAVLFIEDITQQKAAGEARDGFVAQAAHELRTPLTNIRLYAEEAIEFGSDDPQVRTKALNVINTEARRLERIVGNMLSTAEVEAGAPRLSMGEVRLEAMVSELEDDYRALADEKELTLRFDLPPKYPVVFADRDKLMLALHNVVGNALKYTPARGSVTVRLDADEKQITVDVSDTGIGIKPDEQEKVFERFYRANDSRLSTVQGTGLGLALARQVARLHGGDITLKSELNKGSTFTITVPTHAKPVGAAA
ncbi:MAG: PAS domain-containing protein [Phycisphaerales bacterium]|nr:PAS domain-containing protein [Phycisphaerales bacterium]